MKEEETAVEAEVLIMHETEDKIDDREQVPAATSEALRKLIADEQRKDDVLKAIILKIETAKVVMEQLQQGPPGQEEKAQGDKTKKRKEDKKRKHRTGNRNKSKVFRLNRKWTKNRSTDWWVNKLF